MGYLPIHCACSSNKTSPEVVQYLIEKGNYLLAEQEKNISNDEKGQRKNKQKDNSCGGLLIQDSHGNLPLQVLYRRIHFSSSVCTSHTRGSNTNASKIANADANGTKGSPQTQEEQVWTKLILVAKETYVARNKIVSSRNEFFRGLRTSGHSQLLENVPIVHAILESGGSLRIVQQALNLYPQDIIRRDADGATLLMLAVSNVSTEPELLTFLLDAEDKWKHNQSKNTKQDFECTAARVPNIKGRLPLHQAVISGRTMQNGVKELVNAEPRAVQTRDLETGMYPFCLAAIPAFRWDNTCMDTVYELLRHAPHLLHQYCE